MQLKIGYTDKTIRIFHHNEAVPPGWTWLVTDYEDIILNFWDDYKHSEMILGKQAGEAEMIYEKWRDWRYELNPFKHRPQRRVLG